MSVGILLKESGKSVFSKHVFSSFDLFVLCDGGSVQDIR